MPSRPSADSRLDSYDYTFSKMKSRLRRMRTPQQFIAALQWGMDELEYTFAHAPATARATVACRAGCDSCCHGPVDTQAHEVLFAADYIQQHFTPEQLERVLGLLAAHRARISAYAEGERDASRHPCALLVDGSCSIYAGRPQPCRAHHTSDAAVCRAHLADPAVDIEAVYIPPLRARLFAVMLGVDAAIEISGYDERSYDFGSALHEALTNSFCLATWLRKEPAFPDSCLADPIS